MARPLTPVRDSAGREHDVTAPALQLGTWPLPGPDAPVPAETQAAGYYARAVEALENDEPGTSLAAVADLLQHVADFLEDEATSPAQYLPDGSPVAADIREQMWDLRHVAGKLSDIAPAAGEEAGW